MAIANPHSVAAQAALGIYEEVLTFLRPASVIGRTCRLAGSALSIGPDLNVDLGGFGHVYLCGAGKASCGLLKPLLEMLGSCVSGGLVVTKEGHGLPLGPVKVLEAGHPMPDERSIRAGEEMLEFAAGTTKKDLVLFVLSGGASALMETPATGLDLEAIRKETKSLLTHGADIRTINAKRREMSRIKGGKLAQAFGEARVVCLVLSDVKGNDFADIGSGPLWSKDGQIPHVLLGSSEDLGPVVRSALDRGGFASMQSAWIDGEARDEARGLIEALNRSRGDKGCVYGFGEPVVQVRGNGVGGRCQEVACAGAALIDGRSDCALLAGSTDGTDGPTDKAGGLVDGGSAGRAKAKGRTVADALQENDSSAFLAACDGLIVTGPTQSNVNDVFLAVRDSGDLG